MSPDAQFDEKGRHPVGGDIMRVRGEECLSRRPRSVKSVLPDEPKNQFQASLHFLLRTERDPLPSALNSVNQSAMALGSVSTSRGFGS